LSSSLRREEQKRKKEQEKKIKTTGRITKETRGFPKARRSFQLKNEKEKKNLGSETGKGVGKIE